MKNLTVHLVQGSWGITEYLAYPVLMLVATPIFLSQLGTAQYGQWMLLMAVTSMGGLASMGMGTAIVKDVSSYRGRGDLVSAANAVRAGLAVSLVGSVIVAALLLLFGGFAGEHFFARMGNHEDMELIIRFGALLIVLEQIDTIFSNAIRGMERFDRAAQIEVGFKFLTVLIAAIIAWTTQELHMLLTAVTIITLLRALSKALVASHLLRSTALWPRWDKILVKQVLNFGKWMWLQSLGGVFFVATDRLIVGALLGADALARYSVCLQLAQQIHSIPSAGMGFTFPLVSRKFEFGGGESIRKIAFVAIGINVMLAILLALPMIMLGEQILTFWVGKDIAFQSTNVLSWLAAAFLILSINIAPHYILLGCNAARFVSVSNIIGGFVSLVASLILIPNMGLLGAAFSKGTYGLVISTNFFALKERLKQKI